MKFETHHQIDILSNMVFENVFDKINPLLPESGEMFPIGELEHILFRRAFVGA